MPRTIGPADSASQVSAVRGPTHGNGSRGSQLGRLPPPPPRGYEYMEGPQGSRVGRPPRIGEMRPMMGSRGSELGRNGGDDGYRGEGKPSISLNISTSFSDLHQGRYNNTRDDYQHQGRVQSREPPPVNRRNITRAQPMGNIREESPVRVAPNDSGSARNDNDRGLVQKNYVSGGMRFDVDVNRGQGSSASRALIRGPANREQDVQPVDDDDDEEEYIMQKRFIVLTWQTIPSRLIEKLCSLFKVQRGKVRDWADDGLIRFDVKNWREDKIPYDIEPLLAQMAPKDIERWDQMVNYWENNVEYAKSIGPRGGSFRDFAGYRYGPRFSGYTSRPSALKAGGYDSRCFNCWYHGSWCGRYGHRAYFDRY